ncbi:MAG: endonuclease [Bacteroidetes bacterium]|nr:endonuclease [Bacteroidota bacterium]
MKQIKLFAAIFGLGFATANAQCPLPVGYNFENFISAASFTPCSNGWSTNIGGSFTYATGQVGLAGRIDIANEYVQVNTADAMGVVSYYLKGWNTGGTWQGTFKLQESTNGSTWTDLTVLTNAAISSTGYSNFTVTPNANSRYLKWILTNKVSGHNLGVDEINIAAAAVTAQEINVKQTGNTILSGGNSALFNSAVGTPITVTFSIENLGSVSSLNINSFALSGSAAADYTVTAPVAPTFVNPSSNTALTLAFNPSASGSRSAVLTINNDDANESAYVINLNGIGGSFASQPTAQASNLTFSNIKSYRASSAFNAAAGSPDGYLILKKQSNSTITDVPVDGTWYKVGDAIGTSKVIYAGNGTTVGLSNIYAGLPYELAIFSYNGSGAFTNYLTTSPLTGGFTALATMQPVSEYTSLNVNNSNFLTALSAQIYPHTSIFYGNYDETMIKLFTARDTSAGQKVVTCVYSSENYVYTEPFDFSYISREHSYCHQWMPTNPADGTGAAPNNVERKEFNDQHHLFPTNQDDVNAIRSNFPMGEIVAVQSSFLQSKRGQDALGHTVFEPRASHKGDFARAIMYMATCYNGQLGADGVAKNWKLKDPISATITWGQDQNVLKKWHFQDLPDSYEISRNDFLDSLQGNRNPFIDSVRYACYIDFSNMTYISAPTYTTGINSPCYVAVGIKENVATHFEYVLAPNPTSNEFYLMIDAKVAEKFNLDIMDVTGRSVYKRDVDVINGFNNVVVNDLKLNSGVYFVNLHYKNEKITRKLIIQ